MSALEHEVSQFIIDTLKLEAVRAVDIEPGAALFTTGLGLDSADALELSAELQKRYGVTLSPDPVQNRLHLRSVRAVCALIESHRAAIT